MHLEVIQNLVILEDSPTRNLGLSSVTYSPGKANEQSQTLSYVVTSVPDSQLGSIKYADPNYVVPLGGAAPGDPGAVDPATGEKTGFISVEAGTTLTLEQLHSLEFEAAANAFGSSTFTFRVEDSGSTTDGSTPLSLEQSLNIEVLGVNDAPVFNTDPAAGQSARSKSQPYR